jgi:hypothetical protein
MNDVAFRPHAIQSVMERMLAAAALPMLSDVQIRVQVGAASCLSDGIQLVCRLNAFKRARCLPSFASSAVWWQGRRSWHTQQQRVVLQARALAIAQK